MFKFFVYKAAQLPNGREKAINIDFLYGNNYSITYMVYINDIVANSYFSAILRKIKK